MSSEAPATSAPLLSRALAWIGRVVSARAGLVVALLVASLAPTGWLALGLEIHASFLDLLPAEERPVRELREVLAHARAASDISIAVSTTDRAMAERYAQAFVEEVARDPDIAGIGGHIDMDWLLERRLLFVPEDELASYVSRAETAIDRELLRHTGLYIDLEDPAEEVETSQSLLAEVDRSEERVEREEWIVTSDGRYLCVWAFFAGNTGDLEFGRRALERVRAIDARLRDGTRFPRELEVHFAGGIPSRVDDERAIREDLQVAGAVGFLAVVLLIVASLRAPRALVILALPLFIGLVWTFAFARVAVGHLNIISGFLFSILSGLGIEYGIHLMHRFRELRDEGVALEPAIEELVAKTGRALFSGSMTNASVFGVIAFAQFSGFSEFGLIAAVGLLLTLVVSMLGIPALLVLFERWRPIGKQASEASHRPVHVPGALRWAIVLGVPVLSALSVVVLVTGEVRFDGNWRLLAGASETTRFQEYLRHHFSGLYTGGLVYVAPETELGRVVEVIDEVRASRRARGETEDIAEVSTIDGAFPPPERQRARAALAARLGEQLARIRPGVLDDAGRARLAEGQRFVAAAQPIAIEELPYALVGPFVTNDGEGSIVHLRMHETEDPSTEVLVRWAHEARELASALSDAGLHAPLLSENWIAGEIFERVARDGRYLLVSTLLAVFVVLLLDFRRPLVALGVLGAVLLGVLGIAGGMYVVGLSLNFMNAAILPVCVGISLDNAIHVYHRWREDGPGSIPMVLRHTTSANALASTTNLLGFAALGLTHHEGLRSVAWLAVIGVTATYVSTTIWFPMVFATIDARRLRRAQPSPVQGGSVSGDDDAPA